MTLIGDSSSVPEGPDIMAAHFPQPESGVAHTLATGPTTLTPSQASLELTKINKELDSLSKKYSDGAREEVGKKIEEIEKRSLPPQAQGRLKATRERFEWIVTHKAPPPPPARVFLEMAKIAKQLDSLQEQYDPTSLEAAQKDLSKLNESALDPKQTSGAKELATQLTQIRVNEELTRMVSESDLKPGSDTFEYTHMKVQGAITQAYNRGELNNEQYVKLQEALRQKVDESIPAFVPNQKAELASPEETTEVEMYPLATAEEMAFDAEKKPTPPPSGRPKLREEMAAKAASSPAASKSSKPLKGDLDLLEKAVVPKEFQKAKDHLLALARGEKLEESVTVGEKAQKVLITINYCIDEIGHLPHNRLLLQALKQLQQESKPAKPSAQATSTTASEELTGAPAVPVTPKKKILESLELEFETLTATGKASKEGLEKLEIKLLSSKGFFTQSQNIADKRVKASPEYALLTEIRTAIKRAPPNKPKADSSAMQKAADVKSSPPPKTSVDVLHNTRDRFKTPGADDGKTAIGTVLSKTFISIMGPAKKAKESVTDDTRILDGEALQVRAELQKMNWRPDIKNYGTAKEAREYVQKGPDGIRSLYDDGKAIYEIRKEGNTVKTSKLISLSDAAASLKVDKEFFDSTLKSLGRIDDAATREQIVKHAVTLMKNAPPQRGGIYFLIDQLSRIPDEAERGKVVQLAIQASKGLGQFDMSNLIREIIGTPKEKREEVVRLAQAAVEGCSKKEDLFLFIRMIANLREGQLKELENDVFPRWQSISNSSDRTGIIESLLKIKKDGQIKEVMDYAQELCTILPNFSFRGAISVLAPIQEGRGEVLNHAKPLLLRIKDLKGFEATSACSSILLDIAEFAETKRGEVIDEAMKAFARCPGVQLSSVVSAISDLQKLPPEQRQKVVERALFVLESIPGIKSFQNAIHSVVEISDEAWKELKEVITYIKTALPDQTDYSGLSLIGSLAEVPKGEKLNALKLAEPLLNLRISLNKERINFWKEIDQTQRDFLLTVMNEFRAKESYVNQSDQVLDFYITLPTQEWEAVTALAQPLFAKVGDNHFAKLEILKAIAQALPGQRAEILKIATPFIEKHPSNAVVLMQAIQLTPQSDRQQILDRVPLATYDLNKTLLGDVFKRITNTDALKKHLSALLEEALPHKYQARKLAETLLKASENGDRAIDMEDPLLQRAIEVLSITDDSSAAKSLDPYRLFASLKKTHETEALLEYAPPEASVAGQKVSLNLQKVRQESVANPPTYGDLPKDISKANLEAVFTKFSSRVTSSPQKKEIESYIKETKEMELESAKEVVVGSFLLDELLAKTGKPEEPVDRVVFCLYGIVDEIRKASDKVPPNELLSPQEEMILNFARMLQSCGVGKMDGITTFYNSLARTTFAREGSTESKVKTLVADSVEKTMRDTLASPTFLQELSKNPHIRQEAHQTRYLMNRFCKQLGLAHKLEFDPNTAGNLDHGMLEVTTEQMLPAYFSSCKPELVVAEFKRRIAEAVAGKALSYGNIEEYLERILTSEQKEGDWRHRFMAFASNDPDDDGYFEFKNLSDEGALALLKATGYLKVTS